MTASRRRKKLGQHFLTDSQIIDQIIALIHPRTDQTIVEIGPGRGALTDHLVTAKADLHAIEIDPRLVHKLSNQFSADALTLHHADVLNFDFSTVRRTDRPLRIVGNLPYSISTPLLVRLAQYSDIIDDMCFMVQYEVAARLTAKCGSSNYGRLTVSVARNFVTDFVFEVEPNAFSPPPEVRSAIIVMRPQPQLPMNPNLDRVFSDLVRLAFGNRRKTLRNSLKGMITESEFEKIGIQSTLRAQNLSVKEYIALAQCVLSKSSNPLDIEQNI